MTPPKMKNVRGNFAQPKSNKKQALTRWLCTSTLNSYTCCAWAGETKSQFVVERKFISDLHNTSSMFYIRVKIL